MGVADTPCNVSDEPLRLMLVADCGQLHPKVPHLHHSLIPPSKSTSENPPFQHSLYENSDSSASISWRTPRNQSKDRSTGCVLKLRCRVFDFW